MSKIFTPTNQIRLTNVAVVRLKKGGSRFEIACYKNKVLSWRNKLEKDIDEVLQTHTVFVNVSKGQVAKKEELVKIFGTDDQTKVCLEILEKGELQISDKERAAQMEAVFKEVSTIIAEKCVNPENKRPYPTSIISKALKDVHFSAKQNKSAKQQALEMIPKLQTVIPIERAQMRVKVTMSGKEANKLKEKLVKIVTKVEEENWDSFELTMIILINPGVYREIEEICNSVKGTTCTMELLNLKEVTQGEEFIE
ncbi:ribosome maturation protein SBDS [Planococcus citri]|uniref:ribosome maturation protein SBDS n=1 Tax=Planococcus citri TaxID=170843 RepID=UPI0031F7A35B